MENNMKKNKIKNFKNVITHLKKKNNFLSDQLIKTYTLNYLIRNIDLIKIDLFEQTIYFDKN